MEGERLEYQIRELTSEGIEQHFASLCGTLKNLREVGNLSIPDAVKILSEINSQNGHIYVAQKEDGEIIGAGTLLIEQKFIRKGGKVGHVEDVATRAGYEGRGVGKAIMNKLIEEARRYGCYKVILDCSDKNIPFYEKAGFHLHENCMRLDL